MKNDYLHQIISTSILKELSRRIATWIISIRCVQESAIFVFKFQSCISVIFHIGSRNFLWILKNHYFLIRIWSWTFNVPNNTSSSCWHPAWWVNLLCWWLNSLTAWINLLFTNILSWWLNSFLLFSNIICCWLDSFFCKLWFIYFLP